MGPDGLTLMGLDDEADHEPRTCEYCGQHEGLAQAGEIVRDWSKAGNGEARHVACRGKQRCAVCDGPEGLTEWSKLVPFRGTVAHAGCSLDIDSDMADTHISLAP